MRENVLSAVPSFLSYDTTSMGWFMGTSWPHGEFFFCAETEVQGRFVVVRNYSGVPHWVPKNLELNHAIMGAFILTNFLILLQENFYYLAPGKWFGLQLSNKAKLSVYIIGFS